MGGAPTEIERTTTTVPQPTRPDWTDEEIRAIHDLGPAVPAGTDRLCVAVEADLGDDRLGAPGSTLEEKLR